ncbi:two-component system, NarL family, sensor histidine kinase NreB [Phycisphaerales bacterium]|nr:two-component system, NarL family, sensor histidine kinase NreB [Phycisphaerales bacterium]
MPHTQLNRRQLVSPLRVFGFVLLLAFLAEGLIMLVLPRISLWPRGSVGESAADAALLSLMLAPGLWFVAVRPLRNVFRDRGELLERVFEAQEDERRRLARDLHDELGQHLTAILVGLRAMEQAAESESTRGRATVLLRLTSTSLNEVRRLARGLRPGALEDFGLSEAVERLCEEFQATHHVSLTLNMKLRPDRRFSPATEIAVYRLLQESLTNIARHAEAARVQVSLSEIEGAIRLVVRDDGKGFDNSRLADAGRNPATFGLRSMQERAELLRGSLRVVSEPGKGTFVEGVLPITEVG